jgi:hypothetical protein
LCHSGFGAVKIDEIRQNQHERLMFAANGNQYRASSCILAAYLHHLI